MSRQQLDSHMFTRKQRIEVRLTELGMSKKELAKRAGKPYTYVCHVVNGTKQPGLGTAEAIAGVLGLPREDIRNQ